MRNVLIIGCLFVAACSAPEQLRLDIPIDDDDSAVIVATRVDESSPRFFALAIADDRTIDSIPLAFQPEQTVEVTALLYDDALDTLGLPPGAIATTDEPGSPLPATSTIAQATIVDDTPSSWRNVELPDFVAAFRRPTPDRCPRFRGRAVSIGAEAPPIFVLGLDDRWALVGLDDSVASAPNRVVFVDGAGTTIVQSDLPSAVFSGYRRSDGRIWLGGQRGVIYEATFAASPEPRITMIASSTMSVAQNVIDLAGSPAGQTFEQFAVTRSPDDEEEFGYYEWFDGSTWAYTERRNAPSDVTWVEPGVGLFASFWRDGLILGSRDGRSEEEVVTSIVLGSVRSIERIDGLGLVAGTSAGEVHLRRGEAWSLLSSVDASPIRRFHPYPGGFVHTRGETSVGVYVDGEGRCDDVITDRRDLAFEPWVTSVGDDLVVPLRDPNRADDVPAERFIGWFERL